MQFERITQSAHLSECRTYLIWTSRTGGGRCGKTSWYHAAHGPPLEPWLLSESPNTRAFRSLSGPLKSFDEAVAICRSHSISPHRQQGTSQRSNASGCFNSSWMSFST